MNFLSKLGLVACLGLSACMSPEEEKVCEAGYQASLTRMRQDMIRGVQIALPDYQRVSVLDGGNTPMRDDTSCMVYKTELFKHQERILLRKDGRDYIVEAIYAGRNAVKVLDLRPVLPEPTEPTSQPSRGG